MLGTRKRSRSRLQSATLVGPATSVGMDALDADHDLKGGGGAGGGAGIRMDIDTDMEDMDTEDMDAEHDLKGGGGAGGVATLPGGAEGNRKGGGAGGAGADGCDGWSSNYRHCPPSRQQWSWDEEEEEGYQASNKERHGRHRQHHQLADHSLGPGPISPGPGPGHLVPAPSQSPNGGGKAFISKLCGLNR